MNKFFRLELFCTKPRKLGQKDLSEVGFEPTPSIEDQNAHFIEAKSNALESGALDRSAILTYRYLLNSLILKN